MHVRKGAEFRLDQVISNGKDCVQVKVLGNLNGDCQCILQQYCISFINSYFINILLWCGPKTAASFVSQVGWGFTGITVQGF